MPWMAVDDQMHGHRKFLKLGGDRMAATGLWTTAGSWAAGHMSDGFVPDYVAEQWDPGLRLAERLVNVGLWAAAEVDDDKGFRFHDWTERNSSRADIEQRRAEATERKRRSRDRRRRSDGTYGPGDGPGGGGVTTDNGHAPVTRDGLVTSQAPNHAVTRESLQSPPLPSPPLPSPTTPPEGGASRRPANAEPTMFDIDPPADVVEIVAADPLPAQTAQTLVAEWIDHCATRPPKRVIQHTSSEIKILLEEGIPYPSVRAGLAAWAQKGAHPSALASFVNQVSNAGRHLIAVNGSGPPTPVRPSGRVSATTQRLADIRAMREMFPE